MRLFVSIDLPERFADAVADLQREFAAADGLRFTDPAQAHVTLKFLGDVDDDCTEEVTAAVAEGVEAAGVEPFEATYGGLGVFPDLDYIRVLWLDVRDGGERMTALHEAVEEATVSRGFEPEDHEFTPHVTLARMEHADGKELVQETVRTLDPEIGTATVEEIRLKESHLRSDGPVYETVERVSLG